MLFHGLGDFFDDSIALVRDHRANLITQHYNPGSGCSFAAQILVIVVGDLPGILVCAMVVCAVVLFVAVVVGKHDVAELLGANLLVESVEVGVYVHAHTTNPMAAVGNRSCNRISQRCARTG